jgi:hypothetical protein
MSNTRPNQAGITQSSKAGTMTQAAKSAWTVNFVTPAPTAMPADRLKARAELVRNALCTGSY